MAFKGLFAFKNRKINSLYHLTVLKKKTVKKKTVKGERELMKEKNSLEKKEI